MRISIEKEIKKRIERLQRKVPYLQDFSVKTLTYSIYLLFFSVIIALFLLISYVLEGQRTMENLKRREYGQGSYEEEVYALVEGEKEKVKLEIEERQYSKKEIEAYQKQLLQKLPKLILGENKDFEHITRPLNLVTEIKGNPIEIEWMTTKPELVNQEGSLGEEIPNRGERLEVIGQLFFKDMLYEYRQEICIYPDPEKERALSNRLKSALKKENEENKEAVTYRLPKTLDGKKVYWYQEKSKDGIWLIFLLPLLAFALPFAEKEKRKEKKEEKDRQMLLDYPEIVSKLILLLGAGMGLRNALAKIGLDYQKRGEVKKKRWAYEEILYTVREIEMGIGEVEAYIHLGERCGLLKYKTLSGLLSQNVKKGSSGILRLLEAEAAEAFEDRKRVARVRGEEAGTKLLLPMILMLVVVFIILLLPAMMSF